MIAGIDVSLELSSECIVDAQGKIVKEAKVASEPEALALGFAVKQIGLEAGPLSQWLYAGLRQAGFETVLLETRHVKPALSASLIRHRKRKLTAVLRVAFRGLNSNVPPLFPTSFRKSSISISGLPKKQESLIPYAPPRLIFLNQRNSFLDQDFDQVMSQCSIKLF
jgi:transposase